MARTILYIEDDPASRSLVERTLRYGGYRVLTAERGLDGIDIARHEQPDLILTDINLPDLTGREITTMLRADPRFKTTPIVALTAQTLHDQREMAMAAGLNGYLTKPIDIEGLLEQVQHYLQGGQDEIDLRALSDAQARYTREVVQHLETQIRELENFNQSLKRLDTMKDTFIQVVAHELRTPLTLVYGYNRLIEDNPDLKNLAAYDPGLRMLLDGMTASIHRMQAIVNEILTVSRIITNKIELSMGPTELGKVVERAIDHYRDALHERKLTVHYPRTDFAQRLQADWELLELAIRNLLSNAIKYTPDGGQIYLKAWREGEQHDRLIISIRDTGIGINKPDQAVIFQRFASIHDPELHSTSKTAFRGGGIGLGLAVCRGIIEAHRGAIFVKSEGCDPERLPGSEFIIQLPAPIAAEQEAHA